MKIIRVITRLNAGGPSFQAEFLSKALRERGHETLLVHGTLGPGESPAPARWHLAPRRMHLLGLVRGIDPARDVAALWRLFRLFARERPDVVHTHHAKAGALGRLAAHLAGVPAVVHTYHGNIFSGYFSPPVERSVIAVERRLAGFADALVAISPSQKADLADRFRIAPPSQFHLIPLGLDLAPFLTAHSPDPALREEIGFPPSGPVVGIVARLEPVKDIARFLHIARIVSGALSTARFLIVGDGPLRMELEEKARILGIADRTLFIGAREDLPRLCPLMDVLCLTSRNEGTPVSLIEAMAAGRPVVAHAVGGVGDVIEDGRTGILVNPADPEGFARRVATLLLDASLRERLGRAARESVRSRFAPERLADDIEALYCSLL